MFLFLKENPKKEDIQFNQEKINEEKLIQEICGNGICGEGENIENCPEDCLEIKEPICGDNICNEIEKELMSCPQDCTQENIPEPTTST